MNNRVFILFLFFLISLFTISAVNAVGGDNDYNFEKSDDMRNVIWLQGTDMYNIDFKTLNDANIDTIFLNYAAVNYYGEDNISKWVKSANSNGLNVHIWMQVLYHDGFQNPLVNNSVNTALLEKDVNDSIRYASIPGIRGIVLDYIRYPGTVSFNESGSFAVTSFVNNITDSIKGVNKDLIVSGTLMPEGDRILSLYGQNLSAISSKLDYIFPMEYKGNYKTDSMWIKSSTEYYVSHSGGAKVISSIQSYKSDSNISLLPQNEVRDDINNAYAGGARGVAIFRYGLVNFSDVSSSLSLFNQFKHNILHT